MPLPVINNFSIKCSKILQPRKCWLIYKYINWKIVFNWTVMSKHDKNLRNIYLYKYDVL